MGLDEIAGLLSKVSPVFDVLAAARSEPEIGALYRRMQSARKENLRVVVGMAPVAVERKRP